MNKVILIGRLTKDPDIKYVGAKNLARASFTLAVNRSYKNKDGKYDADFINAIAYGKVAETIEKWWHKGDMMIAEGEWRTGSYEKDGKKIYTNECSVNRVEFCGGKSDSINTPTDTPTPSPAAETTDDGFVDATDVGNDIPFFDM